MKIIAFIFFAFCGTTYSQINFILKGQLAGIDDQVLYLLNNENVVLDSTQIVKGVFQFEGSFPEPTLVKLKLSESRSNRINIFLEDGEISIIGKYYHDEGRIRDTRISGSAEHLVYQSLLDSERGNLTNDEMLLMKKYLENNDTTSIQSFKAKKRKEKEDSFVVLNEIARMNSDKYALAYFIGTTRITGAEPWIRQGFYQVYSLLDLSVKQSYYGRKFLANYNSK